MQLITLDSEKDFVAHNTISAYTFYYIVGDALLTNKPLSVVRMGDGEHQLYKSCHENNGNKIVDDFTEEWRVQLGVEGICYDELKRRMDIAANQCDYFAPNLHGLSMQNYNLYEYTRDRGKYVDNFFVNIWDDEHKAELIRNSGEIIFIHRNLASADALQKRVKQYFGIWTSYIHMSSWQDSDGVIEKAVQNDKAKLVLFAGGPASKYISPKIAESGKVVLDIGNSTDKWLFDKYAQRC
jgi:hypothetical protein